MATIELLGRSFSDALYERYCDFDSTLDELKNDYDIVFFVGSSPKKTGEGNFNVTDWFIVHNRCLESGLILHASAVVLSDERISHVGDVHAVTTSCSHVELVDVSSNILSDWHEVSAHRSSSTSI